MSSLLTSAVALLSSRISRFIEDGIQLEEANEVSEASSNCNMVTLTIVLNRDGKKKEILILENWYMHNKYSVVPFSRNPLYSWRCHKLNLESHLKYLMGYI